MHRRHTESWSRREFLGMTLAGTAGSVAELLLAFLKDIKNQKLVARYQHI